MNLKKFKEEFRQMCNDTWGDAVDAWFECAGHMYNRGIDIPYEWEYSPGTGGNGTDEDSYWYDLFKKITNEELIKIGNFLFRYCQYLKFKGKDY